MVGRYEGGFVQTAKVLIGVRMGGFRHVWSVISDDRLYQLISRWSSPLSFLGSHKGEGRRSFTVAIRFCEQRCKVLRDFKDWQNWQSYPDHHDHHQHSQQKPHDHCHLNHHQWQSWFYLLLVSTLVLYAAPLELVWGNRDKFIGHNHWS